MYQHIVPRIITSPYRELHRNRGLGAWTTPKRDLVPGKNYHNGKIVAPRATNRIAITGKFPRDADFLIALHLALRTKGMARRVRTTAHIFALGCRMNQVFNAAFFFSVVIHFAEQHSATTAAKLNFVLLFISTIQKYVSFPVSFFS
jgi:hypothetical protein